jgi:hypothetical protein
VGSAGKGRLLIYVLVVVVAVGHMPFASMEAARDFALSATAERFLGAFGFGLMTFGAVFASASAINADYFGAEQLPVMLGAEGERMQIDQVDCQQGQHGDHHQARDGPTPHRPGDDAPSGSGARSRARHLTKREDAPQLRGRVAPAMAASARTAGGPEQTDERAPPATVPGS